MKGRGGEGKESGRTTRMSGMSWIEQKWHDLKFPILITTSNRRKRIRWSVQNSLLHSSTIYEPYSPAHNYLRAVSNESRDVQSHSTPREKKKGRKRTGGGYFTNIWMRQVEPDLVLTNLETDIKPSSPPTLYTLLIHVHFTLCTSHSALYTLHFGLCT